jgi:hypothetical protein
MGTWLRNGFPAFRAEHPEKDIVGMMIEVLSGNPRYSAYVMLKELFAITLTLTVATSIVESGYSVINGLKNYKTNVLGDEALDVMLNIVFNGPPEISV